jgi:hypothetical protein
MLALLARASLRGAALGGTAGRPDVVDRHPGRSHGWGGSGTTLTRLIAAVVPLLLIPVADAADRFPTRGCSWQRRSCWRRVDENGFA